MSHFLTIYYLPKIYIYKKKKGKQQYFFFINV